jgi:hypothetical protein
METKGSMLLLHLHTVFFWQINVFHQLSWIGLFATKWAFLSLDNYDFQEALPSKPNWDLTKEQRVTFCKT